MLSTACIRIGACGHSGNGIFICVKNDIPNAAPFWVQDYLKESQCDVSEIYVSELSRADKHDLSFGLTGRDCPHVALVQVLYA